MSERAHISVVVPSYCCESCLGPLYEALVPVLSPISENFEIILVDDHSPQADWSTIQGLAERDPRVVGVKLTRNFGQHNAIGAGLSTAEGDWIVVMDCDLQDRPEEIARLYAKAQEGHDVVFARRGQRTSDAITKRVLGRMFHFLHGKIGGHEPDPSIGNFSIVSRRVVSELRNFREGSRNYVAQVQWLGFPRSSIDVEHGARHSGESAYTLRRQIKHAAATILSQSTRPLYASAALGFMMAAGAAALGVYFIVRKFVYGTVVEGWTSVIVSLFFLFGLLFLNLGVLGLYLGSVFTEVKNRPPFVIEKTTRG